MNTDDEKPAKILTLRDFRCANRCGRMKAKNDIYCVPCRDQVTVEAWFKIQTHEEPAK